MKVLKVIFDDSIDDFGYDNIDDVIVVSIDFSQGNDVYIDSDGNQVVYQESSDTYALCTHSMIPSSFYTHGKIRLEDVLLKYINVRDVKNVDIVQMLSTTILLRMQNALIN